MTEHKQQIIIIFFFNINKMKRIDIFKIYTSKYNTASA